MTPDEQINELKKRYIDYIRKIECEKLYYFMLAYSNPQHVVVVKSPSNTSDIKKFLGYEWSSAKGSEGIKYIGVATVDKNNEPIIGNNGVKGINTPLFNPSDLNANDKINTIIRENFKGINIGESEFVSRYRLVDMLDFSGVKLEKAISLSTTKSVEIVSKYPLVELSSVSDISRGASPRPISSYITASDSGVNWIKIGDVGVGEKYITQTKEKITEEGASKSKRVNDGDIVISNSMSAGRPYILKISGCIHDGWLLMSNISDRLDKEYFYYVLCSDSVQKQFNVQSLGGIVQNMNIKRVSQVLIPLPPLNVQREIVDLCQEADKEYSRLQMNIKEFQNRIERLFINADLSTSVEYKLSDSSLFYVAIGKRIIDAQLIPDGKIPVYSANVHEPFGYVDELLLTDFDTPSILWGIDGDWQVNYISAGNPFYPTDHCGVIRIKTDEIVPRYIAWALQQVGEQRRFSRSLRASTERVKRLKLQLPSIDEQRKIIKQVFECEAQIDATRFKLYELENRKRDILNDYLK